MHKLCLTYAICLVLLLPRLSQAQTASDQKPCPTVVGMLVTQFEYGSPIAEVPRVELRQCGTGTTETIQIVAWERARQQPSLVIDTTDFTVVQTISRRNAFLIETTGGPRDRVYVIVYEIGRPVLKLMRVTRGTAKVTITSGSMEVVIPDIYNGDAAPRTEVHQFTLQ